MSRKIYQSGNSAVVSLPGDVLEAVGLALGDAVTVIADSELRQIIAMPAEVALPGVRSGFLEQVDRFIERDRPALEILAKE